MDAIRRHLSASLHRPTRRRAAALLSGLLTLGVPSAAPAWQASIDGTINGIDRALALVVDAAGNAIATGVLQNGAGAFNGTWPVVKFDGATGAQLWRQDVVGTNPFLGDEGRALALDPGGNVVAAGYSTNNGTIFDFTVAKLAGATGAVLWRNDLDGLVEVYDQARDVVVDAYGDVLAGGGLMETGSGIASDFAVVKLAGATGAELWRSSINGSEPNGEDYANAIALDAAGNVIAAGGLLTTTYLADFAVAKFAAADGAVLWQRSFSGLPVQNYAYDVAVDGAGDAVVVGLLGSRGFVAKVRGTDGSVVWQQGLTGTASEATNAYRVALDAAGDAYVSGAANDLYSANDLVVWKLAGADGRELWRRAVTTRGEDYNDDYGTSIALDGQGNVAVGGQLGGRFALLRLRASDGVELMRHAVAPVGEGYAAATAVAFDPAGDLIGAGGFDDDSTGTDEDFFVAKVPASGPIEGCGNGVVESWEQCDDGNDSWTDACLPACVSNYCVDGAAIAGAKLKVSGSRALFQGRLDVGPSGLPGGLAPATRGAQLLVETPSDNERPIYVDLTAGTHAIPTAAAGTCGPGDGWRVGSRSQSYKNASGALDAPTCTAGSAAGLQLLKVDDRTGTGRGIQFKARLHDLPALPRGPLRLTLVLGGTPADAGSGACGVVTFTAEECVAKTRSYQCR